MKSGAADGPIPPHKTRLMALRHWARHLHQPGGGESHASLVITAERPKPLPRKPARPAVVVSHHSLMRKPNASVRRPRTGNSATTPHRIERTFRFRNFREAAAFVQEISELAEAEGHHPDISFGWGYATVGLQTKKIKGLHENDFIMATKIDQIFNRSTKNPRSLTPMRVWP
jgi:pterin-4a-carbinolamine dehydratase